MCLAFCQYCFNDLSDIVSLNITSYNSSCFTLLFQDCVTDSRVYIFPFEIWNKFVYSVGLQNS